MKPSASAFCAGLNGLNWQVQVWPWVLAMVTVPPFLCGPELLPALWLVVVPDLAPHAEVSRTMAMTAATDWVRLTGLFLPIDLGSARAPVVWKFVSKLNYQSTRVQDLRAMRSGPAWTTLSTPPEQLGATRRATRGRGGGTEPSSTSAAHPDDERAVTAGPHPPGRAAVPGRP